MKEHIRLNSHLLLAFTGSPMSFVSSTKVPMSLASSPSVPLHSEDRNYFKSPVHNIKLSYVNFLLMSKHLCGVRSASIDSARMSHSNERVIRGSQEMLCGRSL
ncbi:hypothetical protein HYC85_006489 [Camellia sinensis]|uniref:Uncharacterized protein n=1 Tax=Camellia sinensis TaxID=4442 RepID=A0A7J7HL98_CAMSI|nr:hypothetical protein HYC85_006489 [Camellia sinensis]